MVGAQGRGRDGLGTTSHEDFSCIRMVQTNVSASSSSSSAAALPARARGSARVQHKQEYEVHSSSRA
jgi:hypothetical protein